MDSVCIKVQNLSMAYDDFVIQRNLNFTINRGDIFVIMGGSGCGKSTLLRHMIGLQRPQQGDILYNGQSLWQADSATQRRILQRAGVLFQSGGLLSSMTLAENVALPITQVLQLPTKKVSELVAYKLALVGLAGFEDYYPAELSGGMQKRAGLARAMALDPEILFCDEPSAGLDPVSSKLLDDLILNLRDSLSATIIVVTHELASIFAIANNSVFLDTETRTMIAAGPPRQLLAESTDPKVLNFLTRGQTSTANSTIRQGVANE
ncbi:MAG: ATP-binding cassette domain-containing protein [Methylococcales bacterium]|nr:ATP-binding cassette domain-containing protein [Methylococcales bacterium]